MENHVKLNSHMKYIIYCRKSSDTEDRQVQSLESQETEMKQIAGRYNLEIAGIFKESMSAKSEGRPVFNTVLEMISTGKADALICWKLDRLARNFIDGGRIIDLLQKSTIKEIRTYEGIHLPGDNVLMIAMQFGMANQYSRDLSMNVKRGIRTKLERGEWPSQAPFGYVNDKVTKTIKVNKKTAKYVFRAFQMYGTGGYTLKEISNILYNEGLRTACGGKVHKSKIHNLLTKKIYCGLMERDGKIYHGNHKPIIPLAFFEQVQNVLHNRKHPRPKKHFYSARGFLTCASCNCAITADTQKGFIYYYCTNGKGCCIQHKKYLRSEDVDALLSTLFLKLRFDVELIEIMSLAYKEKNQIDDDYVRSSLERLTDEAKCLVEKELALVDGFSTGLLRKDLYLLKMKEIENRRIEINLQIEEIKANGGISLLTFEQVKNVFLDGNKASESYLVVSPLEKRDILQNLLSNATIKDRNIVSYQFKSPFDILSKAPKISDLCTKLALWDDIRNALLANGRPPTIDIMEKLKLREAG